MAEEMEMPFGLRTGQGPRKHVFHGGAQWRNLAYSIEPFMFGSANEAAAMRPYVKLLYRIV